MEFWIKDGKLLTWLDPSRRIQETVIASGVVDGDYNSSLNEWLVTRENGVVEALSGHLRIASRRYSSQGLSARWNGSSVVVRESDGRSRVYDNRGFLERTL